MQHLQLPASSLDADGDLAALIVQGADHERAGDVMQALLYYNQAVVVAEQQGDLVTQGMAYTCIGSAYESVGEHQQALNFLHNALTIAESVEDASAQATACNLLCLSYFASGLVSKAIEYQQAELVLMEQNGWLEMQAGAHNNLGNLYLANKDCHMALQHHERAIIVAREVGDSEEEVIAYTAQGGIYYEQSNFTRAIVCQEQALLIAQGVGNTQAQIKAYLNMAAAYFNMGNYNNTLQSSQLAWKLIPGDDLEARAEAMTLMADSCFHMDDFEKAAMMYRQQLKLAKDLEDQHMQQDAYCGLAESSYKIGDFHAAAGWYEKVVLDPEAHKDEKMQASTWNYAGHAFYCIGNPDRALVYFEHGLAYAEKQDDVGAQCKSCAWLANCLYTKGLVDRALQQYKKALHFGSTVQDDLSGEDDHILVTILLQICEDQRRQPPTHHQPSRRPSLSAKDSSTIEMCTWSLVTLFSTAETLGARGVAAVLKALSDATVQPAVRCAPHVPYYCMNILLRLAGPAKTPQQLRAALTTEEALDAYLACLAMREPVDPAQRFSVHPHLLVAKTLRLFFAHDAIKDAVLRSKWMPFLLSLLPRVTKLPSLDAVNAGQVVHILSVLVLLVEPAEHLEAAKDKRLDASSETLSVLKRLRCPSRLSCSSLGDSSLSSSSTPAPRSSPTSVATDNDTDEDSSSYYYSFSSSANPLPHATAPPPSAVLSSVAFGAVVTATREVINAICCTADYTSADAKVLRLCFHVLCAAARCGRARDLVHQGLHAPRLHGYLQLHVPHPSDVFALGKELCQGCVMELPGLSDSLDAPGPQGAARCERDDTIHDASPTETETENEDTDTHECISLSLGSSPSTTPRREPSVSSLDPKDTVALDNGPLPPE